MLVSPTRHSSRCRCRVLREERELRAVSQGHEGDSMCDLSSGLTAFSGGLARLRCLWPVGKHDATTFRVTQMEAAACRCGPSRPRLISLGLQFACDDTRKSRCMARMGGVGGGQEKSFVESASLGTRSAGGFSVRPCSWAWLRIPKQRLRHRFKAPPLCRCDSERQGAGSTVVVL